MKELAIATRRSPLALAQAQAVATLLQRAHADLVVRLVEVETSGDRDRATSVAEMTEIGAFVRSVQHAVADGRADLAVHSLKDLPVVGPADLEIVAYPERRPPNDVLVGAALDDIEPGESVGTGSPRRSAQILDMRPDVDTVPIRGNVDTRLAKVGSGEVRAAILAQAGLDRLGRTDAIAQVLGADQMVPAPGQGALAVEARKGSEAAELAGAIDDAELRPLLAAERLLLAETGAGCRSALGALATWENGVIRLDAFVSDDAGPRRASVVGADPEVAVAEMRRELGL